jgi:hypothetical protein
VRSGRRSRSAPERRMLYPQPSRALRERPSRSRWCRRVPFANALRVRGGSDGDIFHPQSTGRGSRAEKTRNDLDTIHVRHNRTLVFYGPGLFFEGRDPQGLVSIPCRERPKRTCPEAMFGCWGVNPQADFFHSGVKWIPDCILYPLSG